MNRKNTKVRTAMAGLGIAAAVVFACAGLWAATGATQPQDGAKSVEQLAGDLSAQDANVRQAATAKLIEMGPAVVSAMQKISGDANADPEARVRAQTVLNAMAFDGKLAFAKSPLILGKPMPLEFVMTNRLSRELGLWARSCSWGHQGYIFEIVLPDGKTVKATERAMDWIKNVPAVTPVPAGKSFAVDFDLWALVLVNDSPDRVKELPLNTMLKAGKYTVRVIYESHADASLMADPTFAQRLANLWIGTIVTPAVEVVLVAGASTQPTGASGR